MDMLNSIHTIKVVLPPSPPELYQHFQTLLMEGNPPMPVLGFPYLTEDRRAVPLVADGPIRTIGSAPASLGYVRPHRPISDEMQSVGAIPSTSRTP